MNSVVQFVTTLPHDVKIFLCIAFVALAGALLFIFFLLSSRQVKNGVKSRETELRDRFQKSLNMIMMIEATNAQDASSLFYVSDLKKQMGGSALSRQVMTDQLIDLRKNLSGSSAQNLVGVFRMLGLNRFSIEKLSGFSWMRKAHGIYELAQMDEKDSFDKIRPMLNSKNDTIREEAFMALVKLDNDTSLAFLNDYTGPLSHWMTMRIHQHLANSDKRQLPDFSQWFNHSSLDVSLFAIDMTRQFKQLQSGAKLMALIHVMEREKVIAAIDAISELETYEAADRLVEITSSYWEDSPISQRIARALGKIGHQERHWRTLADYLNHPFYKVRFEAAQSLYKSGNGAKEILIAKNNELNGKISSLIRHIEDPLLQS